MPKTKNTLNLEDISFVGDGLQRPECVLATKTGEVFASDARGGVSIIYPDGSNKFLKAKGVPEDLLPNGIALTHDRHLLMANLAPSSGVWRMNMDGQAELILAAADGISLPPVNFVGVDNQKRIWISVSSSQIPRDKAFGQTIADGFIVLMDQRGARIVAESIAFANEAIVDPSGEWLYVNETIGRRTIRFPIKSNGDLDARETFAEYEHGTIPDGFNFDVEGAVWMVGVGSNRIIRTDRDGHQETIFEDVSHSDLEEISSASREDRFSRKHIDIGASSSLGNIASLAFGGGDLKTVYLGSLANSKISTFRSPIAGAPPVHWNY